MPRPRPAGPLALGARAAAVALLAARGDTPSAPTVPTCTIVTCPTA